MLSVFNRKQKQKSHFSKNPDHMTDSSHTIPSEVNTLDACSINTKICNSDQTVSHSKRLSRANSASPQLHISRTNRRIPGVSVTFESTLPTEVWQASPSPSPPAPVDTTVCWKETQMSSSISDECTLRVSDDLMSRSQHTERQSISKSRSSGQNWSSTLNRELKYSSSNEESHHGRTRSRSVSVSSASSSDTSSHNQRSGQRQTTNSSSTGTTVTTDSSSSLEMPLQCNRLLNETTKLRKLRYRTNKTRYNGPRSTEERKKSQNVANIHKTMKTLVIDSSSSSSSEDASDDFRWDERIIAELTNRGKSRVTSQPRPSSTDSKSLEKNITTECQSTDKFILPHAQMLPPQMITTYVPTEETQHYPQSCILTRRSNCQQVQKRVNYITRESLRPFIGVFQQAFTPIQHRQQPKSLYQQETLMVTPRLLRSEMLAIVTHDYQPEAQWAHQYKVLAVHHGDYVSVLSQPLASRSSQQMLTDDNSDTNAREAVENGATDTRVWFYVRRWCVEHLVSTGPPGFVPRICCKLLSSNEILGLWHQNVIDNTAFREIDLSRPTFHPSIQSGYSTVGNVCSQSLPYTQNNLLPDLGSTMSQLRIHPTPMQSPISSLSVDPTSQSFLRNHNDSNRVVPSSQFDVYVHANLPPPPPGFGSGGSLGSETEDKDSGRGPSSGSEWGSGRGGSSNVTFKHTTISEQTVSINQGDRSMVQPTAVRRSEPTRRTSQAKTEEIRSIGWYSQAESTISSERGSNLTREDDMCSPDSGLQINVEDDSGADRTPKLLVKSCTSNIHPDGTLPSPISQLYHKPPFDLSRNASITFATNASCIPVFEVRSNTDDLSLFTCDMTSNLINENSAIRIIADDNESKEDENIHESGDSSSFIHFVKGDQIYSKNDSSRDPACWEPYKTVIHVNENMLEKFTLV